MYEHGSIILLDRDAANDEPRLRAERVRALRAQVEAGVYGYPATEVAEVLVPWLLDEPCDALAS